MENRSTQNPESIRMILTTQDENLRQLRSIVSSASGEKLGELQGLLAEQLKQMEAVEQQIWATLFPPSSGGYATEHRMTMMPSQPTQTCKGHIW